MVSLCNLGLLLSYMVGIHSKKYYFDMSLVCCNLNIIKLIKMLRGSAYLAKINGLLTPALRALRKFAVPTVILL